MPRTPNNKSPKKNRTEERLRATPFEKVSHLDAELKSIRLAVWRQFSRAQAINELLTKPEFFFVREEWKAGLVSYFDEQAKEYIYKIFSEGLGLKLELNKNFTQSLGEQEIKFLESLVKSGIEGYGALYFRSKGLIGNNDNTSSEEQKNFTQK